MWAGSSKQFAHVMALPTHPSCSACSKSCAWAVIHEERLRCYLQIAAGQRQLGSQLFLPWAAWVCIWAAAMILFLSCVNICNYVSRHGSFYDCMHHRPATTADMALACRYLMECMCRACMSLLMVQVHAAQWRAFRFSHRSALHAAGYQRVPPRISASRGQRCT